MNEYRIPKTNELLIKSMKFYIYKYIYIFPDRYIGPNILYKLFTY